MSSAHVLADGATHRRQKQRNDEAARRLAGSLNAAALQACAANSTWKLPSRLFVRNEYKLPRRPAHGARALACGARCSSCITVGLATCVPDGEFHHIKQATN